jgi:CBS domain-containing protein
LACNAIAKASAERFRDVGARTRARAWARTPHRWGITTTRSRSRSLLNVRRRSDSRVASSMHENVVVDAGAICATAEVSSMRVLQIMNENVVTLAENAMACDAVRAMVSRGIRHVPVVNAAGHLVGIVTMRDLRHYLFTPNVLESIGKTTVTVDRLLRSLPVRDLMSTHVVTIGPDESIEAAARAMLANHVGSLPVVAGERVVGIVTETDLLRYVVGVDTSCTSVVVSYP